MGRRLVARFDVYRFNSRAAPLLLDVQSDILEGLASRVVVPLAPAAKVGKEELPRLKPRISIDGKDYIMMTTDIAALPVARLGAFVASLEESYQVEASNALDFLFYGF